MIGGNTKAIIQLKTSTTKNSIGEKISQWEDVVELKGFLDLSAGDSKYTTYSAKIQESTHIFICDYLNIVALGTEWLWDEMDFLNSFINEKSAETIQLISENSRMTINGRTYDVMLIDNPMNLNRHLEIYLKYTGGQ